MSDNRKLITLSVLSVIAASILAASPAQANSWGWRGGHHHKQYPSPRRYGYHHDHHDRHHSYGNIVVDLPGKYFRVIIGGKRYYHCNGRYYRRNGRYFERVSSPYGSSMASRYYDERD